MHDSTLFEGCIKITPQVDVLAVTSDLPNSAGVCLLCGTNDEPLVLLMGANLRRLIRQRLSVPQDSLKKRRPPLGPLVASIWFCRTSCAFESQWVYFQIAHTFFPDKLREMFPGLEPWFLRLNKTTEYPFFEVINYAELVICPSFCHSDTYKYWGPLPTRKAARQFLEILQNLFALCRYPHRLTSTAHTSTCPYTQMNRCAAICQGRQSRSFYHQVINQAIQFLDTPLSAAPTMLEREMKNAAQLLQFEKANQLKIQLTQAHKLLAPAYRWFLPLDNFFVLTLQPVPLEKKHLIPAVKFLIAPFLITPAAITRLALFSLEQAEQAAPNILDQCHSSQKSGFLVDDNTTPINANDPPPSPQTPNLNFPSRFFAWACHYLYYHSRDRGLYVPIDDNLSSSLLRQKIVHHFTNLGNIKNKPALDSFSLSESDEPNPGVPLS